MQARPFTRNIRLFLFLLGIALLHGCATAPDGQRDAAFELRMQQARDLQANDPAAAALAFESLARDARGDASRDAWLSAASAWLEARRTDNAARALEAAAPLPPTGLLAERGVLVAAELDLLEQNPRQALLRLDSVMEFSESLRDRAVQLRGRALFQLGASVEATALLNRHIESSADETLRHADSRLIWLGLSRSREPLDLEQLPSTVPAAVRGWIALGRIGQSAWQDPYAFPGRLEQWSRQFPAHPGRQFLLDEILAEHERRFAYPDTIALLLPMTGRYRASAEAVRDGFLAGLYQYAAHREPPRVLVLDAGADATAAQRAATRAVAEGADIIVGPLTKEALSALNQSEDLPVPVLGLNYLDPAEAAIARDNLVQFGLLPEDEAIQVAERSIAEGYTRGVALVPDNDFGLRMTAAFRARFEELGGTLLTVQRYAQGQADYSTPIMRMLNLDESQLRYQQLRSIIGRSVQFEPRRRQDVQFIFLAANAEEARLLRPQLRFHQAISLPVYATSHVYRPGQPDRDLDDIRFADMPWILAPDAIAREIRKTVVDLWPGRFERNGRLYALGFDAFRLVPLILGDDPALDNPLPAMTGLLSIDAQRRIRRDLYWARFVGGTPRLLPGVEEIHPAQGTVHAAPGQQRTQ